MVGNVRMRSANWAASRPKAFSWLSALPRMALPTSTKNTIIMGTANNSVRAACHDRTAIAAATRSGPMPSIAFAASWLITRLARAGG